MKRSRRVGWTSRRFKHLLAGHKIPLSAVSVFTAGTLDSLAETITSHRADAVLIPVPLGSGAVADAVRLVSERFGVRPALPSIPEAKAIAAGNSAFKVTELKRGELAAAPSLPEQTIETVTFPELLLARRQLSSDAIERFTKQLFIMRQALMATHPAAGRIAALSTDRGGAFSVHPGAVVYYKAEESNFMARYSDLIWLALFGFSTVVSAIVWFRRRLFPQKHAELGTHHAELVAMIVAIRAIDDRAQLVDMETKIDDIVGRVSMLTFEGELDPHHLQALELVLGRIEALLTARRAALGG